MGNDKSCLQNLQWPWAHLPPPVWAVLQPAASHTFTAQLENIYAYNWGRRRNEISSPQGDITRLDFSCSEMINATAKLPNPWDYKGRSCRAGQSREPRALPSRAAHTPTCKQQPMGTAPRHCPEWLTSMPGHSLLGWNDEMTHTDWCAYTQLWAWNLLHYLCPVL